MYDAYQVKQYQELQGQLSNLCDTIYGREDDGNPEGMISLGVTDAKYLKELIINDLYRNREEARRVIALF